MLREDHSSLHRDPRGRCPSSQGMVQPCHHSSSPHRFPQSTFHRPTRQGKRRRQLPMAIPPPIPHRILLRLEQRRMAHIPILHIGHIPHPRHGSVQPPHLFPTPPLPPPFKPQSLPRLIHLPTPHYRTLHLPRPLHSRTPQPNIPRGCPTNG